MPGPISDRALIPGLEWAAATQTLPGESRSGDQPVVQPFSGGVLVGLVDAVGHGAAAAEGAERAAAALARYAHEPVGSLLRRCNDALRSTRGAVVSLASFDTTAATVTWVGVGNVAGIVLAADRTAPPSRSVLITPGGIVGTELPRARPELLHLSPGDTLILATDGVDARFTDAFSAPGPPQELADQVLARFGRGTDDACVFVVRYLGFDGAGS